MIGRVISDVKIAELRIRAQMAELEEANSELMETNEELDKFVYSVSHDLSAPLKSILGLVNVSRMTDRLPDHRMYFEKVEKSVLKLDAFIKEVLDYSYNKRVAIQTEWIDIRQMCTDILENLSFTENYDRVRFEYDGLVVSQVWTDPARLRIILNNLLSNAIKYQRHEEGGEALIRVTSESVDGSTLIYVEDNGEGIRAEMLPRIFEMFFRATDKSKGAGLGLYIARQAALRLGGDLFVRSKYGRGTIFTISLPVVESD